jgi:hypothetical protein
VFWFAFVLLSLVWQRLGLYLPDDVLRFRRNRDGLLLRGFTLKEMPFGFASPGEFASGDEVMPQFMLAPWWLAPGEIVERFVTRSR